MVCFGSKWMWANGEVINRIKVVCGGRNRHVSKGARGGN